MASGSNVTLDEVAVSGDDHLHYPSFEEGKDNESTILTAAKSRPIQTDKLYVGNLPLEATLVDLHKTFKRFGDVTDIQLPYNTAPGGRPKGYAFVQFSKKEDAAKAQVKMDGMLYGNRFLKVDFAHQDIKQTSNAKPKKHPKEQPQLTTLSLLKGSQAGRNTNEQIARAEAKLRDLDRSDIARESAPSHHLSLPTKPNPISKVSLRLSESRVRHRGSTEPLPNLPLAPSSKPATSASKPTLPIRQSATASPSPRNSIPNAFSGSSFAKKSSKLAGVKIVKKPKAGDGEKS